MVTVTILLTPQEDPPQSFTEFSTEYHGVVEMKNIFSLLTSLSSFPNWRLLPCAALENPAFSYYALLI